MPEFSQPISSQHQTHECHGETHRFKTVWKEKKEKIEVGRPKLRQELVNSDRKRMNFWELACSYGGHCLTVCQAIAILRGWFWDSNVAKGLIAVVAHHAGFCLWLKRKTSLWVRSSLAKRCCWSSLTPLVREVSSLNTQRDEAAIQPGNPSPVFSRLRNTVCFPASLTGYFLGCCVSRCSFPGAAHLGHDGFTAMDNPGLQGSFRASGSSAQPLSVPS